MLVDIEMMVVGDCVVVERMNVVETSVVWMVVVSFEYSQLFWVDVSVTTMTGTEVDTVCVSVRVDTSTVVDTVEFTTWVVDTEVVKVLKLVAVAVKVVITVVKWVL